MWIETTRFTDSGQPVLRGLKLPEMDEAVHFSDNGKAQVPAAVGERLIRDVESIVESGAADDDDDDDDEDEGDPPESESESDDGGGGDADEIVADALAHPDDGEAAADEDEDEDEDDEATANGE